MLKVEEKSVFLEGGIAHWFRMVFLNVVFYFMKVTLEFWYEGTEAAPTEFVVVLRAHTEKSFDFLMTQCRPIMAQINVDDYGFDKNVVFRVYACLTETDIFSIPVWERVPYIMYTRIPI